eukprot:2376585-Pleurochrysis_carterae.AAC.1
MGHLTIIGELGISVCDGTHALHRAAPERRAAALRTKQRVVCRVFERRVQCVPDTYSYLFFGSYNVSCIIASKLYNKTSEIQICISDVSSVTECFALPA